MRVHPEQLVPQCVILSDVYSKTSRPIVRRDTVVTEEHITVLQRFLIEEVEVSKTLANGLPYKPDHLASSESKHKKTQKEEPPFPDAFLDHYVQVVKEYERLFKQWQSGKNIDIHALRQLIVPLLERVETHQDQVFLIANQATESDYIYHHSVAKSLLVAILAKRKGYDKEWVQVSLSALIADSGMAKMNQSLLMYKGNLPQPEYEEVKKHPTYSYRFVEKSPALTKSAKLGILQHHEQLDGSGYPLGVNSDKIHPYARMIAIADAYHAMTSDRYHQNKKPFFSVVPEMQSLKSSQFDPDFLDVFIVTLEDALLKKNVYLSNGKTGTLVALGFEQQPEVFVQMHDSKQIISVAEQSNGVTIEHII
ncbi:HD-GYP domain, c-di-GMP phosphodiesterase class II (or its inactivated variant) [Pelagirhabdus alkalitolerans]|uniref:HD-GYP domain, c-di-GMP phosphodiesterase class II (Or its inactivated variant) n=1 Tax=Pelagirhabdus alkalitolerans TaxID=1612202 RepID=A0A1G6L9Q3_9BACI|nr:HD domain-containing phosphohydrolase [Pelagirhabdus alkalitolerans]SDC40030.1 HD-GYP domain, c-di-GMP phosphodiesterase class II (or its inactivated variant) [Pelagirhabdus alkalitolerans]